MEHTATLHFCEGTRRCWCFRAGGLTASEARECAAVLFERADQLDNLNTRALAKLEAFVAEVERPLDVALPAIHDK